MFVLGNLSSLRPVSLYGYSKKCKRFMIGECEVDTQKQNHIKASNRDFLKKLRKKIHVINVDPNIYIYIYIYNFIKHITKII